MCYKKVLFLLFAIIPNIAGAISLTLDQAVEKIMFVSDDLKKAEMNIEKMEAVVDQANSKRWFTLDGNASYTNNINVRQPGDPAVLPAGIPGVGGLEIPNNIGNLGVSLTQPIYTFGQIGQAVKSAKSALTMATYEREVYRREIRAMAVQIYYAAKMSDELVVIAEKSLKNAEKSEKLLKNSGAQRANRANLIKVSADIAARKPVLEDAKIHQDQAYRLLRVMAEIDDNEPIKLVDDFPKEFKKFSQEDLLAKLEANPEFALLDSKVKYHEYMASSKQAARYPTLGAQAGYDYYALHTDADMWHGMKQQSASVSLGLTIPLFDGGAASAAATQEYQEASKTRQDLHYSKKMKRKDLIDAIDRYHRMVDVYKAQQEANVLAGKSYNMSLDRFQAGQTSAVELNDVEQSLTRTQVGLANTLYDLALTEATIQKLTENVND